MDLLKRTLVFNPKKRFTVKKKLFLTFFRLKVEQALNHKYVQEFSCPEEELKCDHPIYICMNDNQKFLIKDYREKLYEDIAKRFILQTKIIFLIHIFFFSKEKRIKKKMIRKIFKIA